MRLVAVAGALLLLAGCGGLDEVNVTRSATVTIPAGPSGTSLPDASFSGLGIDLGSDVLDREGIEGNDVDSARLRRVRLTVKGGASLETWLDRVALFAEGPGLPRIQIAERSGIRALPAGTRQVDLDVPGDDLKPYLTAPSARITAEAAGRAPAEETSVETTATVRVNVNVTGLLD